MQFNVFYSEENSLAGARFRVFTKLPKHIDFFEEYALVEETDDAINVSFFQQGQPFEYCGAGALCLADVYADKGKVCNVVDSHIQVRLRRVESNPAVVLPVRAASGQQGSDYYFNEQQVLVRLVSTQQQVIDFDFNARELPDDFSTIIVLHVEQDSLKIHFRYYTRFNHKGEDQATGSVFRYLGAFSLRENTWYEVYQHSKGGARMRCCKLGDDLIYTGNVLPL